MLSTWIKIEDVKPPRNKDFLVISEDGRMWVGAMCSNCSCNELHYQCDSHEPSYIPGPMYWQELPNADIK